jgi:hypothetical protein
LSRLLVLLLGCGSLVWIGLWPAESLTPLLIIALPNLRRRKHGD